MAGAGLLSVVQFMVVLDIAIVNVALPSIKVDLGFSQENLQWVISAYALVFGGFLLLGGRAADLLGRAASSWSACRLHVASLLAGLAWSEASLIGARAFQGLGAAIISPRRCRSSRRPSARARAQHRAGRLGRGRRLRGRGRRAARRRPHRRR
jgi:MFS family permease